MILKKHYQGHEFGLDHASESIVPKNYPIFSFTTKYYEFWREAKELFAFKISNAKYTKFYNQLEPCSNQVLYIVIFAFTFFDPIENKVIQVDAKRYQLKYANHSKIAYCLDLYRTLRKFFASNLKLNLFPNDS